MKNYPFTPKIHVNAGTLTSAGIPMHQIMEHTRRPIIVDLRTIVMTLLYQNSSLTQEEIANIFKVRKSTVNKSVSRNKGLFWADKRYKLQFNEIKQLLEKAEIIKSLE